MGLILKAAPEGNKNAEGPHSLSGMKSRMSLPKSHPLHASKWNQYAGGTYAEEGKHGHDVHTEHGTYNISPFSDTRGKHKGYQAYFINDKGHLPGGLWQDMGVYRSPQQGKTAARMHYQKNFEEPAVSKSLVERGAPPRNRNAAGPHKKLNFTRQSTPSGATYSDSNSKDYTAAADHGTYRILPLVSGTKQGLTYTPKDKSTLPKGYGAVNLGQHSSIDAAHAAAQKHHEGLTGVHIETESEIRAHASAGIKPEQKIQQGQRGEFTLTQVGNPLYNEHDVFSGGEHLGTVSNVYGKYHSHPDAMAESGHHDTLDEALSSLKGASTRSKFAKIKSTVATSYQKR